jgi:hypothetical protein
MKTQFNALLLAHARLISLILCLCFVGVPQSTALAQSVNSDDLVVQDILRRLPDRAKLGALGVLKVAVFPEAVLNRETETLAPGTRIYSTDNMIMLPGSIQDQAIAVVYRRDMLGQVIEAWAVSRDEIAAIKKLQGLR